MNVRLHIERLVVEGVGVRNRIALREAVESELARLIAARGVGAIAQSMAVPAVRAPEISAAPSQLATGIAGAVHASIGGAK